MKHFEPNYENILMSAMNKEAPRLPLYEHIICDEIMEQVLNKKFSDLKNGNHADKVEFFKNSCDFYINCGYDTISYEYCMGAALPGAGALGGHVEPAIKTREDFERYPWDEVPDNYFKKCTADFNALREAMPKGMKAIGGVGNGVFECVQDLVGYMELCYLSVDDPKLFSDLFKKLGDVASKIWARFMDEFGDIYCVLRFGDDLGYKINTLLPAYDVSANILPQYKRIVSIVHSHKKPFLLHSCGCIFDVMDELINDVGIDAKHSNEDQIAPFPVWVERYGDKIGNFGGIDTDAVCRLGKQEMREYIQNVITQCKGHGGFAFGSGNSIPNYVPLDGFINMVEAVREIRGE